MVGFICRRNLRIINWVDGRTYGAQRLERALERLEQWFYLRPGPAKPTVGFTGIHILRTYIPPLLWSFVRLPVFS